MLTDSRFDPRVRRHKENEIMKFKLVALILSLSVASWAQSKNSTQAPPPDKTATKCACCEKVSSTAKTESGEHKHACMHANAKDGKEAASCCTGKADASCCNEKDGKACAKTASNGCCGEKCTDMKDCCYAKEGKKTAHNCCGAGQCGHTHHGEPTPGN
jgi:hypothetical protein